MQGLFRRIWRWIKRFFGRLFGVRGTLPSQTLSRKRRREAQDESQPLTDTDYEFLFMQLLEGVSNGWHEGRILKFFNNLGDRGKQRLWVEWLERFGAKVLSYPNPNQQLGARMVRLGELAQSFPAIQQIGETSSKIGRDIFNKNAETLVWEYDGLDTGETQQPKESTPEPEQETLSLDELHTRLQQDPHLVEQLSQQLGIDTTDPQTIIETLVTQFQAVQPEQESTIAQGNGLETVTLEELLHRLQEDPQLVEQLAQQLGLDTTDPQTIVDMLVNQFQSAHSELESQKPPETAEDWFNLGLQQAALTNWESALASWERALELEPNLHQAWHNRGSALGNLGRLEEALESFERGLELTPDDLELWNSRGSVLYHLQRWEEAIASWDKVLELQATFHQAWYNRGYALEHLGRREEAIAAYHKVLEIEPDFELAQSRLNDLEPKYP